MQAAAEAAAKAAEKDRQAKALIQDKERGQQRANGKEMVVICMHAEGHVNQQTLATMSASTL